ncbi:hypothetical protein [Streptomyces sp. NPDC000134]|uniref:hypothetical protein n=1 Tax=Streptomyces sp. NPDC000134 TaxID=3364536 RepID=UPI00369E25D7
MGRGAAPWPGARALVAGLALAVCAAAAGCGSSPGGGSRPTPAPSATAVRPAKLCERAVAYWARELLEGDSYGDYQSMGLSNRQYDILRAVLEEARQVNARQGPSRARESIDRQSRARCAGAYRDGGPTAGPWG